MKKKEKQMGNITETGHFEKLIKEQEDECPHSVWQQKGEPEYREDGTPYLKWDKDIQCICDSTDELMQLEEELDQEALEWERKDSEEEDSNQEIGDSTEMERGMKAIQDMISQKGILHIDYDDLNEILDIAVTCLRKEGEGK